MRSPPAREKILTLREVTRHADDARQAGDRIVFTNGCFDLLHRGHVRSLEEAAGLGERLIVGVNLDASVRRLKGAERPIVPARARMELVAALGCVDWVVGFAAKTPLRVIRAIRPDILAKGGDWELDEIVGAADVEAWGGRVARLALVPGPRTTDTIEGIRRSRPRSKR